MHCEYAGPGACGEQGGRETGGVGADEEVWQSEAKRAEDHEGEA